MDIFKLAKAAIDSINEYNRIGIDDPIIVLKMPGKWDTSNKKYLNGPRSPQGQIVQEDYEGVTVIFSAIDILAWCVAKGVNVQIVTQPNKRMQATPQASLFTE